MCFAIYATRGVSTFNDVIRFVLYHSVADGLVFANKAAAQVRRTLWRLRFTYRSPRSHSAHASTSTGPVNLPSPRPQSPSIEGKQSTPTGSTSGASTGPVNGKSDGAIYFECLNCKRQVSGSSLRLPILTRRFTFCNTSSKSRPIYYTDCVQSICSSPLLMHGGWQWKPPWWVTEPYDKV